MTTTHVHRYVWGSPEWLARWGGKLKAPPEPREYCRCGKRDPRISTNTAP